MADVKRKIHPPIRPDGTVFRSGRASAPEASWALIPTQPESIRVARYASGLGSQRQLAALMSNHLVVIRQSEIVELERATCWCNRKYIETLAQALGVPGWRVVDQALFKQQAEEQSGAQARLEATHTPSARGSDHTRDT